MYRELLIRCATAVGKPIGGEKTPGNEECLDRMRGWFAGDRLVVVHLVRNPVDRLASLAEAPFRAHYEVNVDPERQARAWVRSVQVARDRAATAPEDYLLVRYEDLCERPGAVARRLFSAIGVPYEAEALKLGATGSGTTPASPSPASTSSRRRSSRGPPGPGRCQRRRWKWSGRWPGRSLRSSATNSAPSTAELRGPPGPQVDRPVQVGQRSRSKEGTSRLRRTRSST